MSTHNICFYEDSAKIIFKLSSYTHLISPSGVLTYLRHVDTQFFCQTQVGPPKNKHIHLKIGMNT